MDCESSPAGKATKETWDSTGHRQHCECSQRGTYEPAFVSWPQEAVHDLEHRYIYVRDGTGDVTQHLFEERDAHRRCGVATRRRRRGSCCFCRVWDKSAAILLNIKLREASWYRTHELEMTNDHRPQSLRFHGIPPFHCGASKGKHRLATFRLRVGALSGTEVAHKSNKLV